MVDGLLALLLLLAGVAGTAPASRNVGLAPDGWWAYVPVVVAALAIVARRRFPLPVLGVTVAAVCAYTLMGLLYGPILFSVACAVYTVAAHRTLRVSAAAAGTASVLIVVCGAVGTGFGLVAAAPVSAWAVVPLAIGVTVRVTREQRLQTRRDELRRHADAERLHVAQEVHDVVGHGLAAITMQADIALHILAKRRPAPAATPSPAPPATSSPAQSATPSPAPPAPVSAASDAAVEAALATAEAALSAISRTSRESLDELRVTLGAVRRGPEEVDDRTPAPGLARLGALLDRTRSAGVPVSLTVSGPVTGLPTAVDLTAYRVVQESLTNVLRHAGSATAEVRVEQAGGRLTITVTDTGHGPTGSSATDGHGLIGMRERVTALGGTLAAGPAPSGGFAVTATLPMPHSNSTASPDPPPPSPAAQPDTAQPDAAQPDAAQPNAAQPDTAQTDPAAQPDAGRSKAENPGAADV
ncbi:histidine kinase [Actinoplanes sp. NPDC051470]|uniref:sensor histidine kinase n=1 Tax=Actinoplanes sp. NPDC051470 TaxID=3157224 RepID=UPI00342722AB